ncbi:hypothetical protein GN956_G8995 [Arapaima gigas]
MTRDVEGGGTGFKPALKSTARALPAAPPCCLRLTSASRPLPRALAVDESRESRKVDFLGGACDVCPRCCWDSSRCCHRGTPSVPNGDVKRHGSQADYGTPHLLFWYLHEITF